MKELCIKATEETAIAARLLRKRLAQKGIACPDEAAAMLSLRLDSALPADGFSLTEVPGGWLLRASSLVDLIHGAGRFLHESRYGAEGMTAWSGRGVFAFAKSFRSIYFASHFYNFYHVAPLSEIREYLEDLALWGYNTLAFWNDLHHFHSFDDPEAIAFRARLSELAGMARELGMKLYYLVVSNESYADSPLGLRAVKEGGVRGGWYDSQICPSRPGGLAYLKEQFEKLSRDYIAGLHPDYISFWPYDQGGCGCEACQPWGGNGFLRLYEALRPIGEKYYPQTKWVLSFWYCNETEWHVALEKLRENPRYCDALLEEKPVFGERPQGIPLLGFPEISMNHQPWGGYGAAPQPERFQRQWDARKAELQGGYPYSEGIYEDLHKVIFAQFYCWDRPAWETVRLYAAFQFGEQVADRFVELVRLLEKDHGIPRKASWFQKDPPEKMAWLLQQLRPLEGFPDAARALELAQEINGELPQTTRDSWRWRLFLLRAEIDADAVRHGGLPSEVSQQAFAELIRIYHAENALEWVRPPLH